MPFVIFALFACLVVFIGVMSHLAAKKRREGLAALAARLGLRYSEAKDREIAQQCKFLDQLAHGSNRYAFNILSGEYHGHQVKVFDYHYETHSTDSKGRRRTTHHYFSFFMLFLPKAFKELKITREGIFSKIAQLVGYDDIDFESHEFSRKFCVRSVDKKFAYDVCNPQMIEYLLRNQDLSIEIEGNLLAIGFGSRLDVEEIEQNLRRLIEVRGHMPDYMFTEV